ncbi:hypothetical protein [Burkholderia sp. JKS000303]|uniref:hypothetical protein n=1 Tax=Burkholderia sp. JKS000303 TaxID=1938747 RepID=UPI000C0159BF|nr:hypothetical protein [Burkholderia sp. JKS000303]PFH12880.1 hypothetical protein BX604_7300 [Burkholderia sp. JKS000303]
MHPKAVTLALAGMVPYWLPPTNTVSFRRPGFAYNAWGATINIDLLRWRGAMAADPRMYERVEWDYLPDGAWDAMSDELLQQAIQGE